MLTGLKDALRSWVGPPLGRYTHEDLAAATNGFSPEYRLGSGGTGIVYHGVLRGGTDVAVKVLQCSLGTSNFDEELKALCRIRHPNIVALLGWGENGDSRYLVYELLRGGSVARSLWRCHQWRESFPWQQRLRVARDVSCALSHMVNSEPKSFHRDIKPSNILLDEYGSAKLSDFGLVGTVAHRTSLIVEDISGTPGYICPVYFETGVVNEASEVFSFGIVLLELLVNKVPAAASRSGSGIEYPLYEAVRYREHGAHERIIANLDPDAGWPLAMACGFIELALTCVADPSERPTFEQIVWEVRGLWQLVEKETASGPCIDDVVLPSSFGKNIINGKCVRDAGPPASALQKLPVAVSSFEKRDAASHQVNVFADRPLFATPSPGEDEDSMKIPSERSVLHSLDPSLCNFSELKRSLFDFVKTSLDTCSCMDENASRQARVVQAEEERIPLLGAQQEVFPVTESPTEIDIDAARITPGQKIGDSKLNNVASLSKSRSSTVPARKAQMRGTWHSRNTSSADLSRARVKVPVTRISLESHVASERESCVASDKLKSRSTILRRDASESKAVGIRAITSVLEPKVTTSNRSPRKNATQGDSSRGSIAQKTSTGIAKATARPKRQLEGSRNKVCKTKQSSKSMSTMAPALDAARDDLKRCP